MNGYREFWNTLLFGSDAFIAESPERYWLAVLVFVVLAFAVGAASFRFRLLAPIGAVAIVGGYLVSLLPFVLWTLSCPSCPASFEGETGRSLELYVLHTTWGGFFAMGIAALWAGVLVARAGAKRIESRWSHRGGSRTTRTAGNHSAGACAGLSSFSSRSSRSCCSLSRFRTSMKPSLSVSSSAPAGT